MKCVEHTHKNNTRRSDVITSLANRQTHFFHVRLLATNLLTLLTWWCIWHSGVPLVCEAEEQHWVEYYSGYIVELCISDASPRIVGASVGFEAMGGHIAVLGEMGLFTSPKTADLLKGLQLDVRFSGFPAREQLVNPFVGLGSLLAWVPLEDSDDPDSLDADSSAPEEDEGEGLLSIYPEVGFNVEIARNCHLTFAARYHLEVDGHFWFYSFGVTVFLEDE